MLATEAALRGRRDADEKKNPIGDERSERDRDLRKENDEAEISSCPK
jgi:hypothetical protein